jgi:phosphoglycolate phosphatase-like HAD superfamily hydrolase
MSVGTGSESAIAEALLNHLGLRHYFSAVVAADHVKKASSNTTHFAAGTPINSAQSRKVSGAGL